MQGSGRTRTLELGVGATVQGTAEDALLWAASTAEPRGSLLTCLSRHFRRGPIPRSSPESLNLLRDCNQTARREAWNCILGQVVLARRKQRKNYNSQLDLCYLSFSRANKPPVKESPSWSHRLYKRAF